MWLVACLVMSVNNFMEPVILVQLITATLFIGSEIMALRKKGANGIM